MKTVGEILRWRAIQHPERRALWHRGRETSWRELDRRANRVANALLAEGVRAGDRVCVLDKTHDSAIEVIFGIAKAGAVYTPVNWRLAPREIAWVLNDAEAPLLFVGDEFADTVRAIRPELGALRTLVRFGDAPDEAKAYAAWRDAASDVDPERDGAVDDTAWQLYTSGTTGLPKGAELTHRNLVGTAQMGMLGFGEVRPGDVGLVSAPLYHIGGAGYALVILYAGASLALVREFVPAEILRTVAEQRITHTFWVPAMMLFLLDHPDCAKTDFSSLRTILYGASPIPEPLLLRAIEAFGCGFVQAYGLTETTGAITILAAEDHVAGSPRLRSCGRAVYGARVRVVDANGRDCAQGEVGEIAVRGEYVMRGYWKRPDATADAIRDGWFHSGDAGYFDPDGYLYVHDRVKDMIVSGGENVYPAEVENVLAAHPCVADCAVIGVPDERYGESVKAVVVLRPGARAEAPELIDFCRDKIAGYKRPRSVDFADALPRNPTGKVLRRELREPYWKGHTRRVH